MVKIMKLLREPSSYAGLAGLALAIGISNESWTIVSTAIAGIAGLVAMLLNEKEWWMWGKLISQIISDLISKGLARLMGFLQKRKVQRLEKQVLNNKFKIKILEHEKKTEEKIKDWKHRLKNKESDNFITELNKIRNGWYISNYIY